MIAIFPEIIAAARQGDIERVAILVRKYFGGDKAESPVLDLKRLVSEAGIVLRRAPMREYGALLAQDEKGTFTITMLINEQTDRLTERFLIAHLLGHYVLNIQPLVAAGDCRVTGYQELTCPMQRYATKKEQHDDIEEDRADQFAAALLLPRGMIKKAAQVLDDLDKIAAFFAVHKVSVARRLADIGTGDGPVKVPDNSSKERGGMARLREIARQLDKSRTI